MGTNDLIIPRFRGSFHARMLSQGSRGTGASPEAIPSSTAMDTLDLYQPQEGHGKSFTINYVLIFHAVKSDGNTMASEGLCSTALASKP